MNNLTSQHTLDTSGLLCPWPLVHTKQKLTQLAAGEMLLVVCTDPSSVIDFKVFTTKTSNRLVEHYQQENKFYFVLKKG